MTTPAQPPAAADNPEGTPAATETKTRDYAEIAVERGYCTAEQVAHVLKDHTGSVTPQDLSRLLVGQNVLTLQQARACERAARGTTVIAGFEVLEKVGQGGMGAVFRARQISMDRIVALKILPPKLAQDPVFKQRFLNEAHVSANLSHLNIISGIDCGVSGIYTYFAMEFVDGQTVRQILKAQGKLPVAEAVSIVHQIGEALVYAKKQGLVHRDIKPDNIMLTKNGAAKLCDLGLAKHTERADDSSMTQAGLAIGTPHYISPEQARGDKDVDFQSDIYSLGATFYHLLTGKTVFESGTSAAVMSRHITDEAKNACDLDTTIPIGYGQIICKMLAKKKADRYESPEALLADIDTVKNGGEPAAANFRAKSSCALPDPALHKGQLHSSGSRASVTSRHSAVQMAVQAVDQVRRPWRLIAMLSVVLVALVSLSGFLLLREQERARHNETATAPDESATEEPLQPIPPALPEEPKKSDSTVAKLPDKPAEKPLEKPVKPDPKPEKTDKPPEQPSPPKPPVETPLVPAPPVVPEPPPPPPVVEIPPPKLELTADVLYTRFLRELCERSARLDLPKVHTEMIDLSKKPEYAVARADVTAELADLAAAINFERDALKSMASRGGEIVLAPDAAKKFGNPKGKIVGFDPARGLSLDVNGAGLYVPALALPLNDILKNAPDDLLKLKYLAARGEVERARPLLARLSGAEKARWERKLELLSADEVELIAKLAFDNLATVANAKSWKTFAQMAEDFDKIYGPTRVARQNANQIREWKLASLDGMLTPWKAIFHAAKYKEVGGGFVELTYDFSTPDQALAFSCPHAPLVVAQGRLFVSPGGGELGQAKFNAPIAALRSLKVIGRSHHNKLKRLRVIFLNAGNEGNDTDPACVFRPPNQRAHLDNMGGATVIAPMESNWREDLEICAEIQDDHAFKWSVNGAAVGTGKMENLAGRYLALAAELGNHSWRSVQLVFQPDPNWLRQQTVKLQAATKP